MSSEDDHRECVAISSVRISPGDLVAFLPYACRQLSLDFMVHVKVRAQEEYVSRAGARLAATRSRVTRGTSMLAVRMQSTHAPHDAPDAGSARTSTGRLLLPVTATVNAARHVLELEVTRICVPRQLIKLVALAVPYNPALARFMLRHCKLRGAILHELMKPAFTALTDICLDDSPVREGNYAMLLEDGRLRRLSLARVALGDEACGSLAARLEYPCPAASSLRVLELASNAVGDVGAASLARALRSNRTLLHLNLVGNRVSDDGAAELLRVLIPFPLTCNEATEARRRKVAHVRSVRATTAALFEEIVIPRLVEEPKKRHAAPRPIDDAEERAAERAAEIVGSCKGPFVSSETICIEGHPYCVGNRVLCYLNLGHNSVSAATVARLALVLHAQRSGGRAALVRVVLEGNPLPAADKSLAMADVEELLEQALAASRSVLRARSDVRSTGKTRTRLGRT